MMNKTLIIIINVLLYIWQLPQNLIAIGMNAFYKGKTTIHLEYWNKLPYYVFYKIAPTFPSGISLGAYVTLRRGDFIDYAHEAKGHCKQSIWLGPLYIFVIGIPSGIHNLFHQWEIAKGDYYKYFCEADADKKAGIKRDANNWRILS